MHALTKLKNYFIKPAKERLIIIVDKETDNEIVRYDTNVFLRIPEVGEKLSLNKSYTVDTVIHGIDCAVLIVLENKSKIIS